MTSKPCATGKVGDVPPRRVWPWALLVGLLGLVVYGLGVESEPHFADESAYISQSSYYDLFWLRGDRDNAAWLDFPALDLTPLAKYLIGASLDLAGYRRPGLGEARAWYADIHHRPESDAMLLAARIPAVILGAVGCVAIFALGTLAADRRAGLVAALLLMANPLYRLSAHRAMADMPAQALVLATAAVALWAWREVLSGRWGLVAASAGAVATGLLGGLAVLAKLNGSLGLLTVGAWALLGAVLPDVSIRRKGMIVAASLIAGVMAFETFVTLNPFMTAELRSGRDSDLSSFIGRGVRERAAAVVRQRTSVARGQVEAFPHHALKTPRDRFQVVAVQGFGRFGPLGPPRHDSQVLYRRYDWARDWGALLWLPWVGVGAVWALRRGRRQLDQGRPPTAWAVLLQAALALGIVAILLPLDWDRYLLDFQPGAALLGAGASVAAVDWRRRREEP